MDLVITAAASYLLYAMAVGFGLVWLAEDRRAKVELALAAVIGVVIVVAALKFASLTYVSPRPFLPIAEGGDGVTALIPHDPDNGFPSNHAGAAGLMAALVLLRRRWAAGLWFCVGAAAVAWGRVAAGVHHLLDVSAGLAIGVIGAAIGLAVALLIVRRTALLRWPPLARWLN